LLNLLAVVVTIAINLLADIIPINNISTAAVSDSFQIFFVPAGYVFAIWGLIYIGLIAYGLYQALPGWSASIRWKSNRPWWMGRVGLAPL
jgi:hypothetical protein